jgi:hypothetical protein
MPHPWLRDVVPEARREDRLILWTRSNAPLTCVSLSPQSPVAEMVPRARDSVEVAGDDRDGDGGAMCGALWLSCWVVTRRILT